MKKIAVPEEGLDTLFGAYDENLKQLESLFGVRIRTQGNEITVDGEPAAVREAERTLTAARGADARRLPAVERRREDRRAARRRRTSRSICVTIS